MSPFRQPRQHLTPTAWELNRKKQTINLLSSNLTGPMGFQNRIEKSRSNGKMPQLVSTKNLRTGQNNTFTYFDKYKVEKMYSE